MDALPSSTSSMAPWAHGAPKLWLLEEVTLLIDTKALSWPCRRGAADSDSRAWGQHAHPLLLCRSELRQERQHAGLVEQLLSPSLPEAVRVHDLSVWELHLGPSRPPACKHVPSTVVLLHPSPTPRTEGAEARLAPTLSLLCR